ncbi:hypothetical protein PRZ48_003279 [Zasmidium cellare]|uniref:Uncharacterized protein n=1 Tax=Zasmidium cellare TaxID=395010 RepID=A0ABR0EVV8_ZASCE|nr:hypothetical protein PRZ48_003279 [Zasmidium cellare]
MHISTTTAALISFTLLKLASAGCYSGGQSWPSDHAGTVSAIQAAASDYEKKSPLSKGEHHYTTEVGGVCLHFVLDNISGQDRSIGATEATDGFTKEYRGCDYGGDSSYTNWRYVLDPNTKTGDTC